MLYRNNKQNNAKTQSGKAALGLLKKNIVKQAVLACLTIVLTVVLLVSMTVAWYTNVVQSTNLTFEAIPWGFDGQIVTEVPAMISAAPGDEGIISLTMDNNSDHVVAVSVNVSKEAFASTLMSQRLYFYVDTPYTRGGEIMDRVYINNIEGYTYTVFSQGNLTLTEEVHNDAQLKWEWVYDVLGYYVLGTVDSNGNVTAAEYLRPIIYDYDEATVTYKTVTVENEDGETTRQVLQIATVDGETTVEEFLVDLSKRDGYEGTIDPKDVTARGYYPVEVDEDGYGVWAYMCTYSEIEKSMSDDVMLSTAVDAKGNPLSYNARLIVSAQKSDVQTETVSTAEALLTAISENSADMIQLNQNITLNQTLTIPENQRVMLDLNGYTMKTNATDGPAIHVGEGSALTVLDGTLEGNPANNGITTSGGELTLSKVNVTEVKYGIYVKDNLTKTTDSKLRLVDTTITADQIAIHMVCNGGSTERRTQLVVDNCTLTGEGYAGITTNGTNYGSDIQILNSTVTGYYAGIYQPQQDSNLTISNSTVSGYTGLVVKGGYALVTDSTVTGTGAAQEPELKNSGWTDTGDGIYLEANYLWKTRIEIRNSTVESTHNEAVRLYAGVTEEEILNADAAITVYSGTFSSSVSEYLAEGVSQTEKNGTFTVK